MKVTCPISGIHYSLTHPLRGHATCPHPMLTQSIKVTQLAEWYLADWAKGDLPPIETHLLGIALLIKLPIDSISLPPVTDELLVKYDRFWKGNIEKMARLAGKLEYKEKTLKRLPKLVVSSETFGYIPEWLGELETELGYNSQAISEKAKQLNRDAYKVSTEVVSQQVSRLLEPDQIENIVIRALRNSLLTKNEEKALPVIIADWALKVTEFPDHSKMRWQRIVQSIFNVDYINIMLMSDIKLDQVKALEEHLMLNTPDFAVGTSHHSILMQRLSDVIPVLEDFNPTVSARKKVNEADLMAALDGTGGGGIGAKVGQGSNQPKFKTLAEKLAARLANKSSQVKEGDL